MKLMQSASVATNIRFYHLKIADPRIIKDFIEVYVKRPAVKQNFRNVLFAGTVTF